MPFNINISDSTNFVSNQSNGNTFAVLNNLGGIGSFIAVPFMLNENTTLNKVLIYASSSTGSGNVMVGFGTWDGNNPARNDVAGIGQSLTFSAFSIFPRTSIQSNAVTILTVSDFNASSGVKYFMGIQTIDRTNLAYNMAMLPINQANLGNGERGNYAINYHTAGGGNLTKNFSANHSCFNWGYFSGSGRTIWYNSTYGGSALQAGDQTRYSLNGTSQFGMSLYIDWNVNAVEMEEFGFCVRSAKATYGLGVTYNVVLYDSDGITSLTASTQNYMPTSSTTFRKVYMPIKYTLQTKKEYFIAFQRDASNASTDYVVAIGYTNDVMAGNAITTYTFTKTDANTAPVKNVGEILFHDISISKIYGNKQGSNGNIIRFYDPLNNEYMGSVQGYE